MISNTALTAGQSLALNNAAKRKSRLVLPLPPAQPLRGAALKHLLTSLLKASLVEELPVGDDACLWRQDVTGQRFGLRLTAKGMVAAQQAAKAPSPSASSATTPSPAVTEQAAEIATPIVASDAPNLPYGKLGSVLLAVSADTGATLDELMALTGWQPHSTRAAVTGLRKRGFAVDFAELHGRKAYRLPRAG